ncbi:MAG: hypothetical protein KDA51_18390, partial [Planctomycetales bacterium]|nr:hypothetical protein [Planctomycetales bacterium]
WFCFGSWAHRALATHARLDAQGREQPTIEGDPGREDQQDNLPIEHCRLLSSCVGGYGDMTELAATPDEHRPDYRLAGQVLMPSK